MSPSEEADDDIVRKPVKQLAGDVYTELLKNPPDLPHAYKRFAAMLAKAFIQSDEAAKENRALTEQSISLQREFKEASDKSSAEVTRMTRNMEVAAYFAVIIAIAAIVIALMAWRFPVYADSPIAAHENEAMMPTNSKPLNSPPPPEHAPQASIGPIPPALPSDKVGK